MFICLFVAWFERTNTDPIISKQTQLIPNAIDIQNLATNENNNPTKINQLKNLIYFGDGTKAIEEEVIGEDCQRPLRPADTGIQQDS